MGNGSIDVGKKTATRKPGQPIVETPVATNGSPKFRIDQPNLPKKSKRICAAMSLQRGDSGRGNESTPQKFEQLVGYRDPKAGLDPWGRPRAVPVKR